MIGLDTDILVRFLTQDDPVQSARANELLQTRCTREHPGFVAVVVICELVWVLQRAYRYDKSTVVNVLDQLLDTVELQVEREDIVHQALSTYRHGSADFADYLIVCGNELAGCEATYSFEQKLTANARALQP